MRGPTMGGPYADDEYELPTSPTATSPTDHVRLTPDNPAGSASREERTPSCANPH